VRLAAASREPGTKREAGAEVDELVGHRAARNCEAGRSANDLLILAGPAQRIEHPLNTVVVAIDEGIVEDDRRGHSPFRPPTLSWRGRTSASRLDRRGDGLRGWAYRILVTPVGETKLSRIRNDEMREFMKQGVDRLYTVLLRLDDPQFVERMDQYARRMTPARAHIRSTASVPCDRGAVIAWMTA
jgi:hypothetical protein